MIDLPGPPDINWARNLSKLSDTDIRTRLKDLPASRQVALMLTLGWKDRLKIVKNSDVADEVVKALPEEEVLLTIKGAGEQDSLPLVALTTPTQLRFLLDVELWTRDTVDDDKVITWIGYLLGCGEVKIIELAQAVDRDLFIIMLSKLISLVPNDEGIKVPEGLPSIMPDEYFTILSNVPEELENIRLLLRILRQWNRDEFYKLLFEVHGTVDAETEETALRWRNLRLEEKGLLDFDEAIDIYGYIGESEAREIARAPESIFHPAESAAVLSPAYPLLLAEGKTFLYEVLTGIEDSSIQNRLRSEIAFSANRLLVADAQRIGEIDSIKDALKRLYSLANVGLLFLTGGDREQAVETVKAVPVKELFQIGFSRVMDLGNAARTIARRWWPEWREEGFTFLEYPQDGIIRGLMLRVPRYYALPGGGEIDYRDFETMREVHDTRQVVDTISVVADTCFHKLGIPRPHEAEPASGEVFAGAIEGVNLRNLMLTGFVNFTLKGAFDISPLSPEDVRELFEKVLEKSASGVRLVNRESTERFLSWLLNVAGHEDRKRGILKSYLMDSLKMLEAEVERIQSWEDLDPRYVSSLIFGRSRREVRGDDNE